MSKKVTCWGEEFPSYAALCRDSRCKVELFTLHSRLKRGFSIEDAAATPKRKPGGKGKKITCWGQEFQSYTDLLNDTRCEVGMCTFLARLKKGFSPEIAASKRGKCTIKFTCWGDEYYSLRELANDPRCIVSYETLRNRIYSGLDFEKAATLQKRTRNSRKRRKLE